MRALVEHYGDTSSGLQVLPDEMLATCFSFLGGGHYRYIAGTCRRFRHVYEHCGERLGKQQTTYWENAAMTVACANKCLDDYQERGLTREEHKLLTNKIITTAAVMGKVQVLEWARVRGGECEWHTFRVAAARGYLEVLQWAQSHNLNWFSPAISYDAAFCGHTAILELAWRHDRRHFDGGSFAARGGHLPVLKWMKERGLLHKYNWHVWYDAAHYGHVHVLEWLVESGYQPDSTVVSGGAKGGHVQVLEWARDHEIRMSIKACAHAAYHGHVHVLQWLREHECPWDGNVLYWARKGRHPEVLEWARANGCPVESNEIIDVDRYV